MKKLQKPFQTGWLRRTVAACVAGALLFCSGVAGAVDGTNRDAGTITSQSTTVLGPESSYTVTKYNHPTNGKEQSYAITYSPGGNIQPVVAYGSKLYGTSTIQRIFSYLGGEGYHVIGGINGDFFSLKTGLPLGMVAVDGELRSSDAGAPAVCFRKDGTAFLSYPNLTFSLKNNTKGKTIQVEHFNKYRQPYALYLLSDDFSATTRTTSAGKEIYFKPVGSDKVPVSGTMELEVVKVAESSGAVSIPAGQLVLTADKNFAQISRMDGFSVGDKVTLTVGSSDSRMKDTVMAVGGGDVLVNNGQVGSNLSAGVHPRSAIGIKQNGDVVLYAVDGRQSHSKGLSLEDLAEELIDMGCVSALNFDGGGSTAMIVEQPGSTSTTLVNSPSDGAMRGCANYLMLVNTHPKDGVATMLRMGPSSTTALKNTQVTFDLTAQDAGYYTAPVPADTKYTVSGGIGTMEGAKLNTTQAGTGTVTATLPTGGSASVQVKVLDQVDSLKVTKKGSSQALSSVTLKLDEQLALSVTPTAGGTQPKNSPTSFQYQVEGDIGTITPDGVFTASGTPGATGKILVSYGSTTAAIQVELGGAAPIKIEDFETQNHVLSNVIGAKRTTERDQVKFGSGAAVLTYDFSSQEEEGDDVQLYPLTQPVEFEVLPTQLYLWAKGGAGNTLGAVLKDEQGNEQMVTFTQPKTDGSYTLVQADLSALQGPMTLEGLVVQQTGTATKGSFCIDQIYGCIGATTDTQPPKISMSVAANGNIFADLSDNSGMTFVAKDAIVTVDGKKVSHYLNGNTVGAVGDFTSPGIHRATVRVCDAFGNMASMSKDIVVIQKETSFKDMTNHWAKDQVQFMADRKILEGSGGYYRPEDNITREEFCTVLSRYLGVDETQYAQVQLPFGDVEEISPWAVNYVKAMYQLGYINGKDGGVAPTDDITRAEMMKMLGKAIPQGYDQNVTMNFADASTIPQWAQAEMKALYVLGVINGYEDDTIRPNRSVTRGEAAKMLYCLY